MSSFLSNKFLKYRAMLTGRPIAIARDLACSKCGYNLRGLGEGKDCPECGQQISRSMSWQDLVLTGTADQRRPLQIGLAIVCVCLIGIPLAHLGFAIALCLMRGAQPIAPYLETAAAISIVWAIGVWLTTPPRLNFPSRFMRWARPTARWTQMLWCGSFVLWLLAETRLAFTPTAGNLIFWGFVLLVITALGALAFGIWMLGLAEDAAMDDAAARMNVALWTVPILSVLLLVIPMDLPFFALPLVLLIALPWAWYLVQFALGVREMERLVAWSIRRSLDVHDRHARMARTRHELDQEAQSQIRPLPPPHSSTDVKIARSDSR
jgi:hypothetical protein